MHQCPGGCGVEVEAEQLACKVDWFRLPVYLREAVNTAWFRRRRSRSDRGAVRAHEAAVAAATAWYRNNPRERPDGQ